MGESRWRAKSARIAQKCLIGKRTVGKRIWSPPRARCIVNTITAVTAEPAEFFRVISWCYEVADIGHFVRATVQDRQCELRAPLAKDDLRLIRLTALIRNEPLWQLIEEE